MDLDAVPLRNELVRRLGFAAAQAELALAADLDLSALQLMDVTDAVNTVKRLGIKMAAEYAHQCVAIQEGSQGSARVRYGMVCAEDFEPLTGVMAIDWKALGGRPKLLPMSYTDMRALEKEDATWAALTLTMHQLPILPIPTSSRALMALTSKSWHIAMSSFDALIHWLQAAVILSRAGDILRDKATRERLNEEHQKMRALNDSILLEAYTAIAPGRYNNPAFFVVLESLIIRYTLGDLRTREWFVLQHYARDNLPDDALPVNDITDLKKDCLENAPTTDGLSQDALQSLYTDPTVVLRAEVISPEITAYNNAIGTKMMFSRIATSDMGDANMLLIALSQAWSGITFEAPQIIPIEQLMLWDAWYGESISSDIAFIDRAPIAQVIAEHREAIRSVNPPEPIVVDQPFVIP